MSKEPQPLTIAEEALALYRRCQFVHRTFQPRDCYKTREPPKDALAFFAEMREKGDDFLDDPGVFEVLEDGWDHEHCDVCSTRIEPGDWYWPNEDESIGEIDLCEECWRRVMKLLEI